LFIALALAIVFPSSGHGILAFLAVPFALRLAGHNAKARTRTDELRTLEMNKREKSA
jgi:hypothetical protein